MAGPHSNFDEEIKKGMQARNKKAETKATPGKAPAAKSQQAADPTPHVGESGVVDTHKAMLDAGHAHMNAIHAHINQLRDGNGGKAKQAAHKQPSPFNQLD